MFQERLKKNLTLLCAKQTVIQDFILKAFSENYSLIKFHEFEREGKKYQNIIQEIPGHSNSDEIFIVGVNYNYEASLEAGSSLAILLELARIFSGQKFHRTLRLVAFAHEDEGIQEYAQNCGSENILGMLCLESSNLDHEGFSVKARPYLQSQFVLQDFFPENIPDPVRPFWADEHPSILLTNKFNSPKKLDLYWLESVIKFIEDTLKKVLIIH